MAKQKKLEWVDRTEHLEDFPNAERKTATDGDDTYDIFIIREDSDRDRYIMEIQVNREIYGMFAMSQLWVNYELREDFVAGLWKQGKARAADMRNHRAINGPYIPKSAGIK